MSGGTAGVAYYLAVALRDSGKVDLEVVRPFAPEGCAGCLTLDGIQVHALSRPAWQPKHLYLFATIRSQVQRKLDEIQPDVVHVQDHAILAGAVLQPCVFTLHGIAERDALFRGSTLTRRLRSWVVGATHGRMRRRLPNVIVISPYARQHLAGNGQQHLWQIPNPVRDSFFEVVRRAEYQRVFSASHMHPLKNVKALVRAFAEVVRKNGRAQLRLAGSDQDGPYGKECRSLAREQGISEHIKFLGLLDIQQVQRELAAASVFALCSLQENAPLSIAEAMAAGVPVLASDTGGIPWMVIDGITGRLVRPSDASGIASALCQMLMRDDLPRMGLAAKQRAERSYRASLVADQTIQVYRQLLEHPQANVAGPMPTT